MTAVERKDDLLDAALIEFAEHGFEGTSTEDIARRAGISQPYLFRLFGTKKELFKASVSRCFRETLEMFQRAAEGHRGEDALKAMGEAYMDVLVNDRVRLRAQMQAYAACDDPDLCACPRSGSGGRTSAIIIVSRQKTSRRGGRVAEGGGLLNRYTAFKVVSRVRIPPSPPDF